MKPPALPLATEEYNEDFFNQVMRILTQYFMNETIAVETAAKKADVNEVMSWLS